MNLEELYQWLRQVRQIFQELGHWQVMGMALYSYGVVLARQCAPSQVAEKLALLGKANTVQRRLERCLANERIDWLSCCVAWRGCVLRHDVGALPIRRVDETKLGKCLSGMLVGLADRGWCIPWLWWADRPDAWPMGQGHLIEELLGHLAMVIPPGVKPWLEADRGIGTSPDLGKAIPALGWYYLRRVQGQTRRQMSDGRAVALCDLVRAGGQYTTPGKVFKGAGGLESSVHSLWEQPDQQLWRLITNCPFISGRVYAKRYWQEASFRDLKSAGWQWQASLVFTPASANRLLLVLASAYAWVLTLGPLTLEEAQANPLMTDVCDAQYASFRNGLRLWEAVWGRVHDLLMSVAQAYFVFLDPIPRPSLKSVGA